MQSAAEFAFKVLTQFEHVERTITAPDVDGWPGYVNLIVTDGATKGFGFYASITLEQGETGTDAPTYYLGLMDPYEGDYEAEFCLDTESEALDEMRAFFATARNRTAGRRREVV